MVVTFGPASQKIDLETLWEAEILLLFYPLHFHFNARSGRMRPTPDRHLPQRTGAIQRHDRAIP
jgi:hypothetical protein